MIITRIKSDKQTCICSDFISIQNSQNRRMANNTVKQAEKHVTHNNKKVNFIMAKYQKYQTVHEKTIFFIFYPLWELITTKKV